MSASGSFTSLRHSRAASRHLRLMRFLSVARAAVFFDTTHAAFVTLLFLLGRTPNETENNAPCSRRKFAPSMSLKSEREMLCFIVIKKEKTYAEMRARRFLRRRFKSARPLVLAERIRNPCVLARFLFFG